MTSTKPNKSPVPTSAQQEVLRAIDRHHRMYLCSPTVAEIGKLCGVGRSTAHETVGRLLRARLVTSIPGSHRSLNITPRGRRVLNAHRSTIPA